MNKTKSYSVNIILSTFFIALFCDIKAVNSYLVAGVLDETRSGPMALLYMFSAIGAFIVGCFSFNGKGRKIQISVLFIVLWVTLFYIVTIAFIGPPYTSFLFFTVMTLISFILPTFTQIDGRVFLRLSMILTFPAISRVNEIFVFEQYSESITMGQSYAFLFPVIATIVYLFIYFKDDSAFWKIIIILVSAINGVFAYYLIFFGSRGPVFAIVSVILFLLLFRHSDEKNGIRLKKGRFAIIGTAILVALVSFVALMGFLQDVLASFGVSLNFVDKFLELGGNGDMSNGRQQLFEISFSDISKHPLFGMGFDQFFNNHGKYLGNAYPHNFIIQILYDGGVVLLLVLSIPIWKGLKKVWKTCTIDEYAVVVALAFSSVPRAFFSGDLWQSDTLWLFFGVLLCKYFIINKYRIGIDR